MLPGGQAPEKEGIAMKIDGNEILFTDLRWAAENILRASESAGMMAESDKWRTVHARIAKKYAKEAEKYLRKFVRSIEPSI